MKSASRTHPRPVQTKPSSIRTVERTRSPQRIPRTNTGQALSDFRFSIPAILLEDDPPDLALESGTGTPFFLGLLPTPELTTESIDSSPLPDSYDTRQIFLTACDPHLLCVHWDFSHDQLGHYASLARNRQLILRLWLEAAPQNPLLLIIVSLESQHLFLPVASANAGYVAELGFEADNGLWTGIAISDPVRTPAEATANENDTQWATISLDPPSVDELPAQCAVEGVPALHEPPSRGGDGSSPDKTATRHPSQSRSMALVHAQTRKEALHAPLTRPTDESRGRLPAPNPPELNAPVSRPPDSADVVSPRADWPLPIIPLTEPVVVPSLETGSLPPIQWPHPPGMEADHPAEGRSFPRLVNSAANLTATGPTLPTDPPEINRSPSSPSAKQLTGHSWMPSPGDVPSLAPPPNPNIISVSSPPFPFSVAQPKPGFWLQVDAELLVCGATESDASLRIAGQPVPLRPDGSFAVRVALPDGQFQIAIEACSAAGTERQTASLEFSRQTFF
jgi:hypothetical protein